MLKVIEQLTETTPSVVSAFLFLDEVSEVLRMRLSLKDLIFSIAGFKEASVETEGGKL